MPCLLSTPPRIPLNAGTTSKTKVCVTVFEKRTYGKKNGRGHRGKRLGEQKESGFQIMLSREADKKGKEFGPNLLSNVVRRQQ